MIVNKANTYVWDVLRALEERNDPKDERLRQYLYKASILLSEEVWSQMLILWSAGMDEERISDKVGFSISQHPDYAMLPPRNPGKQSLHLVSRGGAA